MADKTRVIRLVADASQFKKELGELVTATKKVATASEQTAKSMGKIESLGKSVGTAIKGIAVAAAALAAVKAIGQAAKDMSDLYESSQKLGVSVETLSAFGYAAQMSGVSTESLGVGLKQLNRNLTDMDTATTKSANALRALGVVSSDTGEEAFKKIADQLAKMPDSANKTALAMAVFGKSGSDLIPMLNEGAAGLQAMADEAERFGVAISSDTAAAADAFGDNVDRMNFAMKGAVRQITAGLLPSMVTLTNEMVGAVNEGDRFVSMGETLGEMLIDVAEFGLHTARSVETFGEAIGTSAAAIAAASRGEFALAKQMFVEFGQEAEREAMAVEERIKKLRAAFKSAQTTPRRIAGLTILQTMSIIAILGVVLFLALSLLKREQAPTATFNTLKGEQLTTTSLRGKVVLVNFWATSCGSCIAEMPQMVGTFNKYRERGFEMVAVAMSYDPPQYVQNYAETRQLPFTVALDTNGSNAKAFGDVQLTPTAFLIDKDGNILKRFVGIPDEAGLHKLIEKALST